MTPKRIRNLAALLLAAIAVPADAGDMAALNVTTVSGRRVSAGYGLDQLPAPGHSIFQGESPLWVGDVRPLLPVTEIGHVSAIRPQTTNYGAEPPFSETDDVVARLPAPISQAPAQGTPACGHACCGGCCRRVCCQPRTTVYGDFLFIQASGVDMAFGIPQNGIGPPGTVPIGGVGVAEPQYQSGFRAGTTRCLDDCTSIRLEYTWFLSNAHDALSVGGTNVVNPLVVFPGTHNLGNAPQSASADYDIDFQIGDFDYRVRRWGCESYAVNTVLGFRYAHLDQDFGVSYPFAAPDGLTINTTEISLDGYGIRGGFEGERCLHACSPVRVYGKAIGSLLAGHFNASYYQDNQFNGREVTLTYSEDRFVPIVDLELGLAWRSRCNHWEVRCGYYMSAWFNVITTPDWVQGVQAADYTDISNTITFDGLTTRIEYLW